MSLSLSLSFVAVALLSLGGASDMSHRGSHTKCLPCPRLPREQPGQKTFLEDYDKRAIPVSLPKFRCPREKRQSDSARQSNQSAQSSKQTTKNQSEFSNRNSECIIVKLHPSGLVTRFIQVRRFVFSGDDWLRSRVSRFRFLLRLALAFCLCLAWSVWRAL